MKRVLTIAALLFTKWTFSQDPHFTQIAAAPFTVNPAYTGIFDGRVRVSTNYRQQWANMSTPFTTALVSLDGKLWGDEDLKQAPFNAGIQFMSDKSMKGAFRSNYITLTSAYHIPLEYEAKNTIGLGLALSYGKRQIDFSSLSFEQQFTSGGFDLSLPTGEVALENMVPFTTIGAGLLYCYNNPGEGSFFELGVSAYHLNKPKQSVYNDASEYLPARYCVQGSFQRYVNPRTIFNLKAIYQQQAQVNYLLGGIYITSILGDEQGTNSVSGGLFYRTGDAFSPYVSLGLGDMQIGISYDVSTQSYFKGSTKASSMELSLQWRLGKKRENW